MGFGISPSDVWPVPRPDIPQPELGVPPALIVELSMAAGAEPTFNRGSFTDWSGEVLQETTVAHWDADTQRVVFDREGAFRVTLTASCTAVADDPENPLFDGWPDADSVYGSNRATHARFGQDHFMAGGEKTMRWTDSHPLIVSEGENWQPVMFAWCYQYASTPAIFSGSLIVELISGS